ncbi:hypothetical protein [Vibrio agarivorans]|uniref:Integrase n=1 Tax=Vibrio agarivorans TaxID=153622 RepID=A0ABT7Y6B0_9VIBR|nr:hypothetical protein [Vibrio agarivorans]MDN2483597.1 hypothetical protein [Vibrio agarivorans]
MKIVLTTIKEKGIKYPYILIHRSPSLRIKSERRDIEWQALRQRDVIELKAHEALSSLAVLSSAKEMIEYYIRFNPDYLSPLAQLQGFELKLSNAQSVMFSPSGKVAKPALPLSP